MAELPEHDRSCLWGCSCEGTGSQEVLCDGGEVLPGEETLHERLQWELIDMLFRTHRSSGLVIQIEAKVSKHGSKRGLHGLFRSIEAAPGRYSCEFVELSPADGSPIENRFFTVIPPEEERSEASILVLAKAAALIDSPEGWPVPDGQFDAVARWDTDSCTRS